MHESNPPVAIQAPKIGIQGAGLTAARVRKNLQSPAPKRADIVDTAGPHRLSMANIETTQSIMSSPLVGQVRAAVLQVREERQSE